jgi:hypothetical protein
MVKKNFTKEETIKTIDLCKPCHNQLHAICTEKELERDYRDIEAIVNHPDMVNFLSWIKNKPSSFNPAVKRKW